MVLYRYIKYQLINLRQEDDWTFPAVNSVCRTLLVILIETLNSWYKLIIDGLGKFKKEILVIGWLLLPEFTKRELLVRQRPFIAIESRPLTYPNIFPVKFSVGQYAITFGVHHDHA